MDRKELGVGRETVRNFSSMFTGTIASIIISLFIYVAVARMLGPANYGVYTFAFGFGSLAIGLFGGFGVGNYLIKGITEARHERDGEKLAAVVSSGYTVILSITTALLVIGILISSSVAALTLNSNVEYMFLIVAVVAVFFGIFEAVSENALVGFGRAKLAVATMLVSDSVQLVLSIGLILMGYGVAGALVGLLANNISGFLMATYFLRKEMKRHGSGKLRFVGISEIKKTVAFAAPVGMKNMVSTGMSNFAIVLLGIYVTRSVLGDYGVAMNGFGFIAAFYGNVTHVMLQSFTNARKSKRRSDLNKAYGLILKYSLMLVLPIFVYMAVFANPGVYLIYSHSYTFAPLYLSLIAAGVFINTISIYIATLYISRGKTAKVLRYSIISAAIQLLALLAIVPRFGPIGSIAVLFVLGSVINDVLYIRGAAQDLRFSVRRSRVYRVILVNIALGFIIAPVFLINNSVAVMVAGAAMLLLIYPILLALSRAIDRGDAARLRRFAHELRWIGKSIVLFIRYTDFFVVRIWGSDAV